MCSSPCVSIHVAGALFDDRVPFPSGPGAPGAHSVPLTIAVGVSAVCPKGCILLRASTLVKITSRIWTENLISEFKISVQGGSV